MKEDEFPVVPWIVLKLKELMIAHKIYYPLKVVCLMGQKSLSNTLPQIRNTVEISLCILSMSDKDIQNKWEKAIDLKQHESSVL